MLRVPSIQGYIPLRDPFNRARQRIQQHFEEMEVHSGIAVAALAHLERGDAEKFDERLLAFGPEARATVRSICIEERILNEVAV